VISRWRGFWELNSESDWRDGFRRFAKTKRPSVKRDVTLQKIKQKETLPAGNLTK